MNNIQNIKSVDIKKLISKETGLEFDKYHKLKKCPFCKSGTGKNGTSGFSVKPGKNIFKCFACDKKGNPIDFVKYYKELSNGDATKYVSNNYTDLPVYEPQPEIKTDLSKTIYAISCNSLKPATEYLQSRNIDTHKLPENSYYYDKFSESVAFIDTEKKLINKRVIKPEAGKPKVMQAKGSILTNALYDKTYIPKNDTVFLVEGVINSLSLFPLSSLAIFSTNNKFTDKKKLSKYLKGKKVILAFDNDVKNDSELNPGKDCTNYYKDFILNNIETETLSILQVPENVDINDLHQQKELKDFIKDTDNYTYEKIDILNKPLTNNTADNKHFNKHRFFVKDSCYYIQKFINDKKVTDDISDCVIKFLYRLNNEEGSRLMKVQQIIDDYRKIEMFEITSDDLTKEKLKKILYSKGFSYYGTQPNLDRILKYNIQREKEAEIIETYGWQPESNMFVLSNCSINSENNILYPNSIGMVENENEIYYVPASSPANKKKLSELREGFKYETSNIDFKEFADLFYNSNKESGSIGILFYIISLFRDTIFKHLDFFPYLYLYGPAGGGKSHYAETLTGLFGNVSKGHVLKNTTQASLSRVASQIRNIITYYKEYKKDAPDFVDEYFKAGYDGVSRTIAKGAGKETSTFNIESSGLIDSNFLPTNDLAVFDRMIILDFEKNDFTKEETKAFEKLRPYKEKGLVQITKELLRHQELFTDNFKDVYYTVLNDIKYKKGLKDKIKRERMIKHIALILTPFHILQNELEFPFDLQTLENILFNHAYTQLEKLHQFKATNLFWQALSIFKNEGKVKEYRHKGDKDTAHYKIKRTGNVGSIFLRTTKMPYLLSLYAKHCKSIGIDNKHIESSTELKTALTSKGYLPYQVNTKINKDGKKRQGKAVFEFGYCFEYTFTINEETKDMIIDNQEIEL